MILVPESKDYLSIRVTRISNYKLGYLKNKNILNNSGDDDGLSACQGSCACDIGEWKKRQILIVR